MIGQEVYEWLHEVVGRRRIGKFIKALVRPYVTHHDLEGAYAKWPRMKNAKLKR